MPEHAAQITRGARYQRSTPRINTGVNMPSTMTPPYIMARGTAPNGMDLYWTGRTFSINGSNRKFYANVERAEQAMHTIRLNAFLPKRYRNSMKIYRDKIVTVEV